MEFIFTRMQGESYRMRLRSLWLYFCYVFRALINSGLCVDSREIKFSSSSSCFRAFGVEEFWLWDSPWELVHGIDGTLKSHNQPTNPPFYSANWDVSELNSTTTNAANSWMTRSHHPVALDPRHVMTSSGSGHAGNRFPQTFTTPKT